MPTVVICDGHRLFGEALAQILVARGYDVVACTAAPDAGVAAVRAHLPDLYLTDLAFPRFDGMAGVRAARASSPSTRVLVLSGMADGAALVESRRAGASGFVSKALELERVLAAIDTVARGEKSFDHSIGAASSDRERSSDRVRELLRFLTPREREVLQRLVAGQDTATLARNMGVTYSTARTHIQRLLAKLGVHSKLEAVALVARHSALSEPRRS